MAHDVFISYASSDRAAAEQLCSALEARGLRCWIAPRNVLPGEDWGLAILAAIAAARCMVVVHSAGTGHSVHVRNEVVTATSQRLPIVPVRIDQAQPTGALRLHLAGWHWLSAFPPPVQAHGDALAGGVRASFIDLDATVNMVMRQAVPPPPPAPPQAAQAPRPAPPQQPVMPPQARPPMPSPQQQRPPPPRPSVPPVPSMPAPDPAAPSRPSPVIILLIGGSMLVATGLAAWFLTLGPGRAWLPTSLTGLPGQVPAIASVDPPPPPPVVVASAEPTPIPGGPEAAPTPSPEAPSATPAGPGTPQTPQPPRTQPLDTVEQRPVPVPQPPRNTQPPQQVVTPPAPPPPQQAAAVFIINAGQQDIEQLNVSPVTDTSWGEDWLGMVQITPGNRVLVPVPQQVGCLFDLRVVWRDRSAEELRRQNLCTMNEYRFDGSKARPQGASR